MMYDPMLGQQQPGVMDDPQEAKLRQKQEKVQKKQKRQQKLLKSGYRRQGDTVCCAGMVCAWGLLTFLMWVGPIFGSPWWERSWHGLSIARLDIRFSLSEIKVYTGCDSSSGTLSLCRAVKRYAGDWDPSELMYRMCDEIPDSCATATLLRRSLLVPKFLLPIAAWLQVLATAFYFYYWYAKPNAGVRKLSSHLQILSALAGNIAFLSWFAMCPECQVLPRWWAAGAGHKEFANSALFGLKEDESLGIGWCAACLLLAGACSMLIFFVQSVLPESLYEDLGDSEEEAMMLSDDSQDGYGGDSQA